MSSLEEMRQDDIHMPGSAVFSIMERDLKEPSSSLAVMFFGVRGCKYLYP